MTSNGPSCFEFGQEFKKKKSMICISFRLHNRSFFFFFKASNHDPPPFFRASAAACFWRIFSASASLRAAVDKPSSRCPLFFSCCFFKFFSRARSRWLPRVMVAGAPLFYVCTKKKKLYSDGAIARSVFGASVKLHHRYLKEYHKEVKIKKKKEEKAKAKAVKQQQ